MIYEIVNMIVPVEVLSILTPKRFSSLASPTGVPQRDKNATVSAYFPCANQCLDNHCMHNFKVFGLVLIQIIRRLY